MALRRLILRLFLTSLVLCGLCCSRPAGNRDRTLATAFVGPASVNLRQEIDPKSTTVATAHFGDKVDIVGFKRRFIKVRTRSGQVGWIDDHLLLDSAEMAQVKAQSEAARKYPSQGTATTDMVLNVHVLPYQTSPAYAQIKAGEKFDVLEHRLVTVTGWNARRQLIPPAPKVIRKKKENSAKLALPPKPAPPPLPADWQDLSKEGDDAVDPKPEEPAPAARVEDWSLVRTASAQSGWIRTSLLYMAIPDEVAQYSGGRRIRSYFKLGTVHDEDRGVKDNWLWTTITSPNQPFDFDAFRVFIWNPRRHRYETVLAQRHLVGYFPTLVDSNAGTFAVCAEGEDGQRYRREYKLLVNVVKFIGEKPCEASATAAGEASRPAHPSNQPSEGTSKGTFDRLKGNLKSIMK